MSISYTQKINKRTIGSEVLIINELHIVGTTGLNTSSPNYIRLIEVPLQENPSTVVIPGYTETTGTPGLTQYQVDYTSGRILFDASHNGNTVFVTYKGRGSEEDGEDINEVQQPLGAIANLDGTLSSHIVKPINISSTPTDDFTFPRAVTINGNLDVKGTTTTIESTVVTITDPIMDLNYNNVTPLTESGFRVKRTPSTDVLMVWNEADLAWELTDTSATTVFKVANGGVLTLTGDAHIGGNILPNTDSTSGVVIKNASGANPIVIVDTTNQRVGIGVTPLAVFHNAGSTVLGLATHSDPSSILLSDINHESGVAITTSSAHVLTLPSPTDTIQGRIFSVLHSETSTGTLSINGQNVGVGKGASYTWNGGTWIPVGSSGGFQVVSTDPVSSVEGDSWYNTTDGQFKGKSSAGVVILG